MSYKVLYYNTQTGEWGRLPDNSLINAGGVEGPYFTVGGRALMFADGTSTSPTGGGVTLQSVYENSPSGNLDLVTGKHLSFTAGNNSYFAVNADTGKVTISGDLEVLGSSTVIEGVIANTDQVFIRPPSGAASALIIEPMTAVAMAAPLISIRHSNGGPIDLQLDPNGNTYIRNLSVGSNMTVVGTINGVDLVTLFNSFTNHTDGSASTKHRADQVSVDETNLDVLEGNDVQEIIEDLDQKLVRTFRHNQLTAGSVWTVTHNRASNSPTVTVYDSTGEQVWPDRIQIVSPNQVQIHFNTPIAGSAVMLFF
jgi:hypothetical protein